MDQLKSNLKNHLQELRNFLIARMGTGGFEFLKATKRMCLIFREIATSKNSACMTCVEVLFDEEVQSLMAQQINSLTNSDMKNAVLKQVTDLVVLLIKLDDSQDDAGSEKLCRVSKPLLQSLTSAWPSSTSVNTLYNFSLIFTHVWRSDLGRRQLKRLFSANSAPKTQMEARKFIPLIVMQAQMKLSTKGVLHSVPHLMRHFFASFACMINAWRMFARSNRVSEMAWCGIQCHAFLRILHNSILPQFNFPDCDVNCLLQSGLGRLLRCLTRATIEVPKVSKSFHHTVTNFILAMMNFRHGNEKLMDFFFALMSEPELRRTFCDMCGYDIASGLQSKCTVSKVTKKLMSAASNLLQGWVNESLGSGSDILGFEHKCLLQNSMERALKCLIEMRPLCRADIELMAPPHFVSKALQEIPDHELCSEPELGCYNLLERFGDRLSDNVKTQECLEILDRRQIEMLRW